VTYNSDVMSHSTQLCPDFSSAVAQYLNTGSGTALVSVSKFVMHKQCGSGDIAGVTDQVTYRALGSPPEPKSYTLQISKLRLTQPSFAQTWAELGN
jgi:hypothetical protein